ncbi:hypothetical protein [Phenylobacterium sp.]|jgi:hypothetical protein|uniref:hypothetical protein n=1 Tax=Phenylobacterium sp. TaxID=1871053 RepID=UPI002F3F1EF7
MDPAFGGFFQNAYVTTDLDQALEVFRTVYGVPSFLVHEVDHGVSHRGRPGRMKLRLALANLDGVQIEVIEAAEGCVGLYREGLPAEGFGLAHHHVAMRIGGTLQDWRLWRSRMAAGDRGIVLEGEFGEAARFAYLDDRRRLGHYTEYLWMLDGGKAMDAAIPSFTTGS